MNKSVIGSAVALAMAVAVAGPWMGGCPRRKARRAAASRVRGKRPPGSVGMALSLPGGETIASVNWTINQGSTVVKSGTYSVPSAATTISFLIPNVNAGSGYRSR